jgi:hypothetical protein
MRLCTVDGHELPRTFVVGLRWDPSSGLHRHARQSIAVTLALASLHLRARVSPAESCSHRRKVDACSLVDRRFTGRLRQHGLL